MKQALIDGDVLRYEIGYAAEAGWQKEGPPPFNYVEELLNARIANICALAEASDPIIYLTGKTNFRTQIAKKRPYKERPSKKPWHFKNITAYMNGIYNVQLVEGLEADDLMSIEQTKRPNETIICTRDKDLRQVPGWHYGWELGNQPSFGPLFVDEFGKIWLSDNRKSIKGYGGLFFYSQCLTGDVVDTVPGLPKCGAVEAFELLGNTKTLDEAFKCVREAYRGFYGDSGDEELLEQGQLLYMIRELDENGSPKIWRFLE